MLSRATCVSLWCLFAILILKGRTDKEVDTEMYCDDTYRAKYIVSTSLFSLSADTNDSDKIQGKSMIGAPYRVNTNNELYSNEKDNESIENSFESIGRNPKASFEKNSLSNKHTFLNGVSETRSLNKGSVDRVRQPFYVMVNAQINVSMSGDEHEEPPARRRKRETWEGQDSCVKTRRIIGGISVDNIEEVPYIVFVDSGCAGTIISNIWVVTAAHCIGVKPPSFVYGGSIKLYEGCKHKIEKIIVHPNYQAQTYKADITLLRLYQPFTYSPAIKPMLMESDTPKPGDCGTISGWGSTKVGGTMEYYLRTTNLPIIHNDKCKMFPNISDDQFCAGFQDAHTDSCQGDSGGPFIVNNLLVGIVSFGYKCAIREIPGVYTSVPFYRKWIENITGIE